jgi:aldose 1-epimerase
MLILQAGEHRVDIAPEMGAVASWSWRGRDIFRPTRPEAIAARDPLGVACFAMAPWVSRIRDSRFAFAGRAVQLKPETDPRLGAYAIHGEAWRALWRVRERSASHAVLTAGSLAPGAGAWPWAYEVLQAIRLDDDGLHMTLTLSNRSAETMPYSFGLHPYFLRGAETRLTARTRRMMLLAPDGMPIGEEASTHRWQDEVLTRGVQDHCYRDWDGVAALTRPQDGLRIAMRATGCDHLQVYAPDDDYVCVEPQTAGPDAVNCGPAGGLRVLNAGERASLEVSFSAGLI